MALWYWNEGAGALNMDTFAIPGLAGGVIGAANDQGIIVGIAPATGVAISGQGFTYSGVKILSGTLYRFEVRDVNLPANAQPLSQLTFDPYIQGPVPSAALFSSAALAGTLPAAFETLLAGNDTIRSASSSDLIRGYAGNDQIEAGQGADTVFGGAGDDDIAGSVFNASTMVDLADGANYLRGEDGNDTVAGGRGFDDINGNQGDDLCIGYGGDDWVVGGKDNDRLYGDERPTAAFGPGGVLTPPVGNDIVYGNLGNDTCDGGGGNDIVRGGQGEDSLTGRDGDDWLSGDRGADTMAGGAGADIFHTFGDAGVDRVIDFNLSQGDRVQLDPGTAYTVSQVGADTVIDMTGGGQMILVGVQMSSLTAGWIFGA